MPRAQLRIELSLREAPGWMGNGEMPAGNRHGLPGIRTFSSRFRRERLTIGFEQNDQEVFFDALRPRCEHVCGVSIAWGCAAFCVPTVGKFARFFISIASRKHRRRALFGTPAHSDSATAVFRSARRIWIHPLH